MSLNDTNVTATKKNVIQMGIIVVVSVDRNQSHKVRPNKLFFPKKVHVSFTRNNHTHK